MQKFFLSYFLPFVLSVTSPLFLGYFLVRDQIYNEFLMAAGVIAIYLLLHIPQEIATAKSKGEKFNKKKYFCYFISGLIFYTFFLLGGTHFFVSTTPILRNWLLSL